MLCKRLATFILVLPFIAACGSSDPNRNADASAPPVSGDGGPSPAIDGQVIVPMPHDATVDSQPPVSTGISVAEFCNLYGFVGCCKPDMGALFCQGEETPEIFVSECPGQCGWNGGEQYYDCGQTGADPSGTNPLECPEIALETSCTPSCTAGTCDNADGCGGTCGCNAGQSCDAGVCTNTTTPPTCTSGEKRCSGDNVESCSSGSWAFAETCDNGCLQGMCMGGSCSGCDIAASSVKVSMPYASTSPPTLVEMSGSCYVGLSSSPCGYQTASVLKVLANKTASVAIKDVYGGGYVWGIQFDIEMRDPTSSEYSSLASKTGIPSALLKKSPALKVTTKMSTKPTFSGYTVPSGVDIQLFLPTGGSDAYFRFTSSTKSDLDSVLSQVKGSGLTMEAPLIAAFGSGSYTYTFKLNSSGIKVTQVSK